MTRRADAVAFLDRGARRLAAPVRPPETGADVGASGRRTGCGDATSSGTAPSLSVGLCTKVSRKHNANMKGSQSQRSINSGDCNEKNKTVTQPANTVSRTDRSRPFGRRSRPCNSRLNDEPIMRASATTMKIPPANQYKMTMLCAG